MSKAKKLLKFIEELLNPDHDYNDKHKLPDKPIYKTDQDFVMPAHKTLSAEANEHLNPTDSTSPQGKAAVSYSGGDHYNINHFLRHGEISSLGMHGGLKKDHYAEQAKNLKNLTKNPTKHEFYTYRGISGDAKEHVEAEKGDIIHDKGFTSTSLRPGTADSFHHPGSGRLFRIHVRPGTKGHYLSAHEDIGGRLPTEAEFTLHPGTKFRVGDSHVDLRGRRFTDLHIHSQED